MPETTVEFRVAQFRGELLRVVRRRQRRDAELLWRGAELDGMTTATPMALD